MNRWIGLAAFAVVLLGGAFGLSALAVEWRQDTTDVDPLASEIADMRTDIDEIKSLLEATPTPILAPTPVPTPEPAVATVEVGAVAESQGMRLTVDDVQLNLPEATPRAFFTLANVDAAPETTGTFRTSKVLSSTGFVCRSGVVNFSPFVTLQPGERLTFYVYWECPSGETPNLLTIGGIVFQLPQA